MKLLNHHMSTNTLLMGELASFIKNNQQGIVYANDTVNFIANRIGVFNMLTSMHHMEDLGLT